MNDVTSELKQHYDDRSPRTATLVILYCNLIINIAYGVIYTLLNKTLFPDAATNIAISLAFTETVIVYFTIITVHNKKSFMFMWVVLIILFNSSLLIITCMILCLYGYFHTVNFWEQYISRKCYELDSQFPHVLCTEWKTFLLQYALLVVAIFVLVTLFFKLYSVWTVHRNELKSSPVQSIKNILFGKRNKKLRISRVFAAPVP